MDDWHRELLRQIPDFTTGRLQWLRRIDVFDGTAGARNLRLVFDYAGEADVVLVAKGVRELPLIPPATAPATLPYAPYDLGEFLITQQAAGRIVLFDELKGWRIVAAELAVERIDRPAH